MQLAEHSMQQSAARQWMLRVAVALGLAGAVFALAVVARTLISQPDAPRRQIAKIAILPDTPPPPPPPREEPKKVEQRPEPRQQPQPEQPRPAQAPPPSEAPIKMEGQAGDGASPFAAGAVTQDYKGGTPTTGPATAPPAVVAVVDRANERFYANTARQMLRDELQRQLKADASELIATLAIWIDPDGQIRRFELQPSGHPERDAEMQAALEATTRSFRLPPPPPVAQPLRFRVTLRPQG